MSLTSRMSPLVIAASAAAAFTFFSTRDAHAGIEACNNINVSASAVCKVEAQGGCTAQCTPVKMEVACAAKLEASCSGQCTGAIEASCTGSCQGTCEGKCTADPGSLDCSANCKGTCEANCSGKCSASGNKGECEASCKATCGGTCDAKCEGTPPSASCQAKCQASCNGSCQAKANLDCQLSCQSKGYAKCKADLEGGCKAKCTAPEGALFCDGQYVDAGNNLKNCIDALNAYLNVKVSGSAQCSGNECSAEGKASASCAAAPISKEGDEALNPAWLGIGVAAIAGSALRRRRRH